MIIQPDYITPEYDYYTIEFRWNASTGMEVLAWIRDKLEAPSVRCFWRGNTIYFKNANDHLAFLLIWGHR